MSRFIVAALFLVSFIAGVVEAKWVNGYTRSDGTYVSGYNRSESNSTVTDNYSYKGNQNPYTGETGSNYYKESKSSYYYGQPKKSSSYDEE